MIMVTVSYRFLKAISNVTVWGRARLPASQAMSAAATRMQDLSSFLPHFMSILPGFMYLCIYLCMQALAQIKRGCPAHWEQVVASCHVSAGT